MLRFYIILSSFILTLGACSQQNSGSNAPSLDSHKKGDQWAELSDFQIKKGMQIHLRIHVDPDLIFFPSTVNFYKERINQNISFRVNRIDKAKNVTYISKNVEFDDSKNDILITINHHMKANGEPYKLIYTVRQKNLFWQRIIEKSIDEPYEKRGVVARNASEYRTEKQIFMYSQNVHYYDFLKDIDQRVFNYGGE